MIQIEVVEKINTHILCLKNIFRKSCFLRISCEIMSKKYGGAREASDNMAHARGILDK
jgi:hypothetical protein